MSKKSDDSQHGSHRAARAAEAGGAPDLQYKDIFDTHAAYDASRTATRSHFAVDKTTPVILFVPAPGSKGGNRARHLFIHIRTKKKSNKEGRPRFTGN